MTATDMTAEGVVWDLTPLLPEPGEAGVKSLLDRADARAAELAEARGRVGEFDAARLASFMTKLAELYDLIGRADNYAGLDFSTDTTDPARGALMQLVEERSTSISAATRRSDWRSLTT